MRRYLLIGEVVDGSIHVNRVLRTHSKAESTFSREGQVSGLVTLGRDTLVRDTKGEQRKYVCRGKERVIYDQAKLNKTSSRK